MKIIFIIIAVVLFIFLLLFSKITIISDIKLNNFKADLHLQIKILTFFKINYRSGKKKKEKKSEPKEKKKVTLKDINNYKDKILKAVPILGNFLNEALRIKYFETDILVALSDPMNTGLAYAALTSAANIFYKSVPMKKCYLDVNFDFDSESGLTINHKSNIYVRVFSILKACIKLKTQGIL